MKRTSFPSDAGYPLTLPDTAEPTPASRRALQAAYLGNRARGLDAAIAALADIAAQDHFDWRRPGHASDPLAYARAAFAVAGRQGSLRAL